MNVHLRLRWRRLTAAVTFFVLVGLVGSAHVAGAAAWCGAHL